MNDYTPIDCSFHDHLESYAVLKTRVRLSYLDGSEAVSVETVVLDVRVEGDAEYLLVEGVDAPIRLDAISGIEPLE
jgi:transcriptional antiterminator Rof (Rho-off)